MKKFICGLMAIVMLMSMMSTTVLAAEGVNTNTNSGKYYLIDLEAVDEQTWKSSAVNIQMYVNGKDIYIRRDGITCADRGEGYKQYDEKDLGIPVLFRYDPNGKLDQDSMNITFIPLRKIAQALGCPISWNDETKNVVLDTPKGRIEFPINATSVTAPDGTVYEEQTYRFPNGDPINIVAMRDNRTYVTVRFISSFMMPDATYRWKGTERLTVAGTIDGKGVEKTYGLNANYLNGDDNLNWNALPNLMAALEGQRWTSDTTDVVVWLYAGSTNVNLKFSYYSTEDGLVVKGYDPSEAYVTQLPIIEGLLKDMVCDADREAIVGLLNEINEHMSEGWTENGGYTDTAVTWRDNHQTKYTLTETIVEFSNYFTTLTVKNK